LKRVAISQSNFIPWLGYFDLIRSVDVFVIYDVVQFTRRDWRNRNRIKTPKGAEWVTVPVQAKGNYLASIDSIRVDGSDWIEKFQKTIHTNYARAKHYVAISASLFEILNRKHQFLHDLNLDLIRWVLNGLEIQTQVVSSARGLYESEDKNQRLIDICKSLEGTTYVSAPAATAYLDQQLFSGHGINLEIFKYPTYPSYEQIFEPYVENLSVIDCLMNVGWGGVKEMLNLSRSDQ
jgi:hypothetical protein